MDQRWEVITITEGARALDLFVDRVHLCRQFLNHLNDDPSRLTVTVLHGDGGNGKSLLLDCMRLQLCRRMHPDNWTYLKSLTDEECVAQSRTAEGATQVPWARFDFALGPRDSFGALLKLRRDLTGSGLQFPLFDFAVVTYLHKSHQLTPERVRELFPAEEIDFALELAQLVKAFPGIGVIGAFLSLANKRHGAWFERYRLRRALDEAAVAEITALDHETELVQRLPLLFAQDVNSGLGGGVGPDHVAFFFDNHGALIGHERDLPDEEVSRRDEWLRRLILGLDPATGITIIVAGREPPRWADAPRFPVPNLEIQRVGDLSQTDALAYLTFAGISDIALQQQLCDDARVSGDQIHPLSLGLGADLALAAVREGRTLSAQDLALDRGVRSRQQAVANRFLQYVNTGTRDMVQALAVCRSFTPSVFQHLGDALRLDATTSAFRILVGFSFVRQVDDGRFRIHELLRTMLGEQRNEFSLRAHEAMERYYRARAESGSTTDFAEAVYHANRQNWLSGVREWGAVFDVAYRQSNMGLCRSLIEILPELVVETEEAVGALAYQEAEFLNRVGRTQEAQLRCEVAIAALGSVVEKEPTEPELLNMLSAALLLLGALQQDQVDVQSTLRTYTRALDLVESALIMDPHNWKHLSNKSSVLLRRAEIYMSLGQPEEATQDFIETEVTINAAIAVGPGDAGLHSNAGIVEMHFADVFARSELIPDALRRYRRAIDRFTNAIRLMPDTGSFYNNRGSAYQRLGKLLLRTRKRRMVVWCYYMALKDADAALKVTPHSLSALWNKATYCEELGWLLATWFPPVQTFKGFRDARKLFRQGIRAFRTAAELAPDTVAYSEGATRLEARLKGVGG